MKAWKPAEALVRLDILISTWTICPALTGPWPLVRTALSVDAPCTSEANEQMARAAAANNVARVRCMRTPWRKGSRADGSAAQGRGRGERTRPVTAIAAREAGAEADGNNGAKIDRSRTWWSKEWR